MQVFISRRCCVIAIGIAGLASSARADYMSTVLGNNPSAYYRFGETSGTNADDASPNNADATYTGTLSLNQAGASANLGSAISTSTVNAGYVEVPSAAVGNWPDGNARSFEVWFKTTGSGVILGNNGPGAVDGGQPGGWVPGLYVGTDGLLRAETFWKGAVAPETSTAIVNDGAWHHAAVVFSGNGGTETLYLDGAVADTKSGVTQSDYAGGAYAYHLGAGYDNSWPGGGSAWTRFNGSIDEAAFYQTALTPQNIADHIAAAGVPEPSSIGLLGAAGALFIQRRRK